MPFSALFLGGPAVLEKGINLSTANGITLPFSDLELKRLRWSIPLVAFALCTYSLGTSPKGTSLKKICDINFEAWLVSRQTITVRLGDYIVSPKEINMLKESGYFKVGLFSDIRDIQLNQMILMVRVMQFRIDGLKFILNGFDDRNRAEGYSQELIVERINVLAHGVSCLVFGHEPDESSLQQAFIIDVLAEAQKHIFSICEKYL